MLWLFTKNLGLGLFLECRHGATRGAEVGLGYILRELGYDTNEELNSFFDPEVQTITGKKIGKIQVKVV